MAAPADNFLQAPAVKVLLFPIGPLFERGRLDLVHTEDVMYIGPRKFHFLHRPPDSPPQSCLVELERGEHQSLSIHAEAVMAKDSLLPFSGEIALRVPRVEFILAQSAAERKLQRLMRWLNVLFCDFGDEIKQGGAFNRQAAELLARTQETFKAQKRLLNPECLAFFQVRLAGMSRDILGTFPRMTWRVGV